MALEFRTSESWKNLGTLPEVKKSLGLQEIKLVKGKEGKLFCLFVRPDGQYTTTKYDTKNSPKLEKACLWETPDGHMVGLPSYEMSQLEALDSL